MKNEDRSLELYIREIRKIPLTRAAEEVQLVRGIKRGDDKALERLIKGNLRLVVSIAKRYQNQGLPLVDLINEGNLALIKAAKMFDGTRGGVFVGYVIERIRWAIQQALAEQGRIFRLPLYRADRLLKIGKIRSRLEQSLARAPSPDEIAKELELSEGDVSDTLKISKSPLSLDAPSSTSEDNPLIDILEVDLLPSLDVSLRSHSLRIEFEKVFDSLTPREAEVINLYFGLHSDKALTLKEIGTRLSLTIKRVRKIKDKAISKLRHNSLSPSSGAW